MLLNIEHHTQYVFSESVPYTIQQLRLTPRDGDGQIVKHWQIKVNGQLTPYEDAYGNRTHTLVVDQPHHALQISVSGEVETGSHKNAPKQILPVAIYLRDTAMTQADAAMTEFAQPFANAPLNELMHALRERIHYSQGATEVNTPATEAFKLGKGVCQDYAHVFIGCCRSLGLPARYVSGYLFTADGSLMQTHAWAEVWHEEQWLGLDIANGTPVNETHVKLAHGLDYRSASPITGSRMGGGIEGMASIVSVNQQSRRATPLNLDHLLHEAQSAQQ